MRDCRLSPPAEPIHPVWSAIRQYEFGPPDADLPFARRLARDNGWTLAAADRAIEEYRRFVFLAVTAGSAMTPSDAVDQVWHLHLTYTREYWDRFCGALGRPLHHGPTAGGDAERHRFFTQYAETLHRYELAFGTPPADLWPNAAQRLLEDPRARRVHPRDALIIPRRVAWLAVAAVVPFGIIALLLGS